MRSKALIIAYHRVKDEMDAHLRPTKVADFERQMRYLAKAYHLMPLETMALHIRSGKLLPRRAIAVTFDDGYRDNYEHAYPVLKEYNIPATVFVTTEFIGTGKIPSWDRGHYRGKTALMLSWKQVREMSDGGISFGSHTLTHPFLARIPQKEVEREIRLSKDIIEQATGKPVTALAYPSGNFNSEIKGIVREAGYASAVSTRPGYNSPHGDVYAMKRNVIQLQSVCHRAFPLSYRAEVTGMVGHVRNAYYRIRGW